MSLPNRRFRGKAVYSKGILNPRDNFRDKIDTSFRETSAPVGGGGGGGLQWLYDDEKIARSNARIWLNNSQTAAWKVGGSEPIYLGNATGAESITYSATGLPTGLSIDSGTGQLTGSASTVGYNQVTVTASDGTNDITKTVYIVQRSQQIYDSPGTYTLTLPNYIDKIHAVCIGGGGVGQHGPATPTDNNSGGAGGGLRWIEDLPVTGGEELNIFVGSGGVGNPRPAPNPGSYYTGTPGGDSKITRGSGPTATTLLLAEGGDGAPSPNYPFPVGMIRGGAGTPTGLKSDGSRVGGGDGGHTRVGSSLSCSGGGAGSYMGPGGNGRTATEMSAPTYSWPSWAPTLQPVYGPIQSVWQTSPTNLRAGDSPGGGGTGGANNPAQGPGGGGVGLYGMTGQGGKFPTNAVAYYPGLASVVSIATTVHDNGGDTLDTNPSYAPRRNDPQTFAYGGSGGFNVRDRPGPAWAPFGFASPTWATPSLFTSVIHGGKFGGGGGGGRAAVAPHPINFQGGRGGVRIIWGDDRQWIGAKNTGDL